MPPLPSTTQTLTTRLNALSEQNKNTLQLVQRLAKLDFQPGSQPLEEGEGDVRLELSAEIHETLKGIEEDLELLRAEVEDYIGGQGSTGRRRDSARESEKSRLAVLLARLTEDLRSSRAQFRKAQLTAKRNADRAKLKERELLFSSLQSGDSTPSSTYRRKKDNSQLTADEVVTSASSDVTAALRRTHQLMQNELSRSRFAQETLEQSTRALEQLGDTYTDLSTLLSNSRTLVTTLLKSQKSDTWYLETAFYILVTTIIWLIFRRWLYGPLTWFIWWPLKLFYKFTVTLFGAAGLAGSAKGSPNTNLIVKPSATGTIPQRVPNPNEKQPYIRVGRGGGGGWGHDPHPPKQQQDPESLSEQVGRMAEQSTQQHSEEVDKKLREEQDNVDNQKEPVIRGDGTVLEESDRPRNPKKRIWEENVESAKHEEALKGKQEADGHRKRDEL
ncbi:Sec20-domain-containing protein [Lophiotrema nucula]|uniref:Sec20-domain-containing protein n=1 Tax=Lophiotrema nucula TaxID=690887 RepID=A0A6A5ZGE7_9PLEO|nr:Sec20-domain-containing protein [Lophiotrema nucula]